MKYCVSFESDYNEKLQKSAKTKLKNIKPELKL